MDEIKTNGKVGKFLAVANERGVSKSLVIKWNKERDQSAKGQKPSTLVDSIDLMVSVSDEICVRQQQLSNTVVEISTG